MAIELIQPSNRFEQSYRRYIVELGEEGRYPFPLDWPHQNFDQLIRKLQDFAAGTDLPDGFVPSTTLWLVEGDELLGVSNLRHHLNDQIRKVGGHIGLGIRPSHRGKGLGKILLALTIDHARERGIREVHIHCHKDNQASVRMIKAAGATLDSEILEKPGGRLIQRYVWNEDLVSCDPNSTLHCLQD